MSAPTVVGPGALAQQVRVAMVDAGFQPVSRAGRLTMQLAARRPGQRPLVINGSHLGPEWRLDLGELDHALIRLVGLAEHWLPRGGGADPELAGELFGLIAGAWRGGCALAWQDGRLAVHRDAGGLELVTWRDDAGADCLLNAYPVTARSRGWTALPPSVAGVVPVLDRGRVAGSGVTVGPGLVLTALHVVASGGASRRLSVGPGRRVHAVRTVALADFGAKRHAAAHTYRLGQVLAGLDQATVDLALLVVPGHDAPPAAIRATPVPTGEQLAVVGFPRGRFLATLGPVDDADEAHVLARVITGPGASGGPALDAVGAVAGIVSIGHPQAGELLIGPELLTAFLDAATRQLTARAS